MTKPKKEISVMAKDEILRELLSDYHGEPFMCAICYCGLETSQAKTKHMEKVHGYETLCVEHS